MSTSFRMFQPRNIAIAGGTAGVGYFIFKRFNIFNTPGTKNIEDRWSAGGGATTHTPAVATKRGDPNMVVSPQETPKGPDSTHFNENVASAKSGSTTLFEEKWNEHKYGNKKGK